MQVPPNLQHYQYPTPPAAQQHYYNSAPTHAPGLTTQHVYHHPLATTSDQHQYQPSGGEGCRPKEHHSRDHHRSQYSDEYPRGRRSSRDRYRRESRDRDRRRYSSQESDHRTPRSPRSPVGFWPNPDKEYFYKVQTPPWAIPRKRKPKGDSQEFYYDLSDEELKWKHSGEITTSNRFELLSQEDICFSLTSKEDIPSPSKKNKSKFNSMQAPDFRSNFCFSDNNTCDTQNSVYENYVDTGNKFITQNSVMNKSFKDFMLTKDKLLNNNSHYMYSNKHNFCSGYSPDFITLDSIDGYNFSKGSDYSHYYLYVNNNMYLKPLSNPVSKYDNNYFDNLRHAYKISRSQGWWNTEKGIPIPGESEKGFISVGVDINNNDAYVPSNNFENNISSGSSVPRNSEKGIHRNSEKGTHGIVGDRDTHPHTHKRTHTHTCIHTNIHTHTNIQTHIDRHMHTHKHIHIH